MIDENMVERVARALYDDWVREEGDRGQGYCSWDLLPDKDTWRPRARAAIEAMREPTREMVQARINTYPSELRIRDGDLEVWRTMIDAASGPIPIVDMKDLG